MRFTIFYNVTSHFNFFYELLVLITCQFFSWVTFSFFLLFFFIRALCILDIILLIYILHFLWLRFCWLAVFNGVCYCTEIFMESSISLWILFFYVFLMFYFLLRGFSLPPNNKIFSHFFLVISFVLVLMFTSLIMMYIKLFLKIHLHEAFTTGIMV